MFLRTRAAPQALVVANGFWLGPRLSVTPLRTAMWIFGQCLWWCDASGRHHVRENIRPLMPTASPAALERTVRRSFVNFLFTVTDMCRIPNIPPQWLDELRIIDPTQRLQRGGYDVPCVALTGHCNWEMLAHTLNRRGWIRHFSAVSLSQGDAVINRLFERMRAASGGSSLLLDASPLASLRALKRGDIVALLGDRDYSQHGRYYPIGAGRLCLPVGPAGLAVQCQVPIRPSFLLRRRWSRFALIVCPDIKPNPALPKHAQMDDIMQRIARTYDRVLRAAPANWVAFHDAGFQHRRVS